jgi:hypothetical protein
MKRIFFSTLLFAILLSFSCKKQTISEVKPDEQEISISGAPKENEGLEIEATIKDWLFGYRYDSASFISQSKGSNYTRILKRYTKPSSLTYKIYFLVEVDNTTQNPVDFCYVISSTNINGNSIQLSNWNFQTDEVYIFNSQTNNIIKPQGELTAHFDGKVLNLETPFSRLAPPPGMGNDPSIPICTDWYWTTWDDNTGEVLNEVYLFTTCNANAGSGGGSPNPNEQLMSENVDKMYTWKVDNPNPTGA